MKQTIHLWANQLVTNLRIRSRYRSIIGLAFLAFVGCEKSSPLAQSGAEQPVAVAKSSDTHDGAPLPTTKFPYEVTDGLGRKVIIAKIPQRIVSLAPKNTEMLFAVGGGGQIVGTTTYCNYPPAAAQTEKVGGFSAKSISLERVVSLKPDLVMSVGDLHAPIIQELERLGLPVIAFSADSFAGLFEDLQLLGRITGHENESSILVKKLTARMDRIKETAAAIPSRERLTVFYHVWADPLTGAGPTSFLGEMIKLCGGVNIIDDSSTRFPKLTTEVLLARNPDVIVSSSNHADLLNESNLQSQPGWSGLKAVQTKRIHLLDGDIVSRCSPRIVDALELMADAIYPTQFAAQREKRPTSDDGNEAKP